MLDAVGQLGLLRRTHGLPGLYSGDGGCGGRDAPGSMKRTILLYGVAVALGATLLQWLEYRHLVRVTSTPAYVTAVSVFFIGLGIWIGHRLARPEPMETFERNDEAMDYLGISPREHEVLELLARGHSNREIAEALFVSPNTVKSHLSSVYDKLDVSRRTQAVRKARALRLIP